MNVKKLGRGLLALAVTLSLTGASALAEISFSGKVVASETAAVLAPFGGLVDEVNLRVGDPVAIGDPVATIATTKVYASADGTVSGVFAKEGDATEGVEARYGGEVYIAPTNRYVVSATTEKAYNSSATKYVGVGEEVYLSCSKDGSHTGTAVVISVSDVDESGNTPYKLEVIGGEFYMGETVGIYRSTDYDKTTCIGRGTVQQNAAIAVKGTGSVLKMHVQVGDTVERGELLFETVEGGLDGLYAMDNAIVSNVAGVVASVDVTPGASATKGGKLITVYPEGSFQIEMLVSELDLRDLHEGDKVSIEFDWDTEGTQRAEGTVSSISHVNAGAGSDSASASSTAMAEYSAYIDFDASKTPDVRLGMSVIVYTEGVSDAAEGPFDN